MKLGKQRSWFLCPLFPHDVIQATAFHQCCKVSGVRMIFPSRNIKKERKRERERQEGRPAGREYWKGIFFLKVFLGDSKRQPQSSREDLEWYPYRPIHPRRETGRETRRKSERERERYHTWRNGCMLVCEQLEKQWPPLPSLHILPIGPENNAFIVYHLYIYKSLKTRLFLFTSISLFLPQSPISEFDSPKISSVYCFGSGSGFGYVLFVLSLSLLSLSFSLSLSLSPSLWWSGLSCIRFLMARSLLRLWLHPCRGNRGLRGCG